MTEVEENISEKQTVRSIDKSAHPISQWFGKRNSFWFTLLVSLSAFSLYTCVYAFRKTFAAATFEDLAFFGISYKVLLVTFQVCGYAMSKFFGIKIIAELNPKKRSHGILLMILIAGFSWLLFAIVNAPFNLMFLFFNGLSLGLVWGMVFGYLEGRKTTEVLGAVLSVSFIFSSGLCRSMGGYILRDWNVSENWMPFVASCIFFVPLILFLFLLDKVPPPTQLDEQLRTKRKPMNASERKHFITTFLPGIIMFVLAYMLLTAFRDFRDNFSAEVWKSLGYSNSPGIYTQTEIPVSIGVLIVIGSIMLIRNNKMALMVNHIIIITGMILIGASTFLFELGMIAPPMWMILMGLGLYLGYVPFNSIFFDRMLAAFRYIGTVGFIMYVADSFGYLGSVGVLFLKEFGDNQMSWLEFIMKAGYFIAFSGAILMTGSMFYFHYKHTHWKVIKGEQ